MTNTDLHQVILIPGLPESGLDHFIHLNTLQSCAKAAGLLPVPFDWPGIVDPRDIQLGLRKGTLIKRAADELHVWLQAQVKNAHTKPWFVVAHSAGGAILYRWVKDHQDSPMPSMSFIVDSPRRISRRLDSRGLVVVKLPGLVLGRMQDAKIDPSNFQGLSSRKIPAALDGKLVVFSADPGDVLMKSETMFPRTWAQSGMLRQRAIKGIQHCGSCSHDESIRQIISDLRGFLVPEADSR